MDELRSRFAPASSTDAPLAETPASGAAPVPTEIDWSRRRAPATPRDIVLLSETHLWIRSVPSSIHPKHLGRYHPHLANRLAQCWGDATLVERFMEEVLVDRRGQRKGLSDRVRMELDRLRGFHARRQQSNVRFSRMKLLQSRHAANC